MINNNREILQNLKNRLDLSKSQYPFATPLFEILSKVVSMVQEMKARVDNVEKMEGPKGEKGDQGDTGPQGERGEQGPQGIAGKDGKDGKQGKMGLTGPAGERGERGLQGIQGVKGERGEKGDTGDKGKDGSPDTPIEVRDKLSSLKGSERLDAKHIKNLPEVVREVRSIFGSGGQVKDIVAGSNVTITKSDSGKYTITAASGGVTDHASLTGLTADDHTQYALLLGRSGGQTLIGGTASGNSLTLQSTSNATKGTIIFGTLSAYDQVNDRLGIGTLIPSNALSLGGEVARTIAVERRTASNVAGSALTIQAGGATSGATNKAGGALNLIGGQSTGTGAGGTINLQSYPAGSSGTGTNTLTTILSSTSRGVFTFGQTTLDSQIVLNTKLNGNAHIINQATTGLTSASQIGLQINNIASNSIDSGVVGIDVQATIDGNASSTGGSATGLSFTVGVTGTPSGAIAVSGLVFYQSTANFDGQLTAFNPALSMAAAAGYVDTYVSFAPQGIIGDRHVKNFYQVQADIPTLTAGGVVDNFYGLWIGDASSTGITTGWAIYATGGNSSHVGNWKVGDNTAPTEALDFAEAKNLKFGTTTGTKIGTATSQKLAFHNATPVIQRAGSAQAAVATTASTNITPFGYTTAAQADALVTLVNEIRATLVEKGLMKGSA